jgi:hypothetical protein
MPVMTFAADTTIANNTAFAVTAEEPGQPLAEQIEADTEPPIEVPPEVAGDPDEQPEQPEQEQPEPEETQPTQPQEREQAKEALATAALIIKTATQEIAGANETLTKEAAENQEWARKLTKAAWKAGTDGGHCGTWDTVMKRVGLPPRPTAVTVRCSATAKVSIKADTMVKALTGAGMVLQGDGLKAFEEAFSGVEFEAEQRTYANNIAVTPDVPDDPFDISATCICAKARTEYVRYVERNYGAIIKPEDVTINTGACTATTHLPTTTAH